MAEPTLSFIDTVPVEEMGIGDVVLHEGNWLRVIRADPSWVEVEGDIPLQAWDGGQQAEYPRIAAPLLAALQKLPGDPYR